MESNTRFYTVELNDAQRDSVAALNKREGERLGRLVAELRAGSSDAQALADTQSTLAEGFRNVEFMRGADDMLSLGTELVRRWYRACISTLAEGLLGEVLSGQVSELSELSESLRETIDSTDIVIYTHKASAALMASDNQDAWKEIGLEAPTIEQMAFRALETDVLEELQRLADSPPDGVKLPEGFNLHDSDTWQQTSDEATDADEVSQ